MEDKHLELDDIVSNQSDESFDPNDLEEFNSEFPKNKLTSKHRHVDDESQYDDVYNEMIVN